MDLLYKRPNMDAVEKRQDVVYKIIDERLLKLDVYYSSNTDVLNIPTVVVVHGSSSIENIKDIKLFQSWGKVLAASGFNTVVFNWRPEESPDDIKDLIFFLLGNSNELKLNVSNLNIFAFSSGVEIGVKNIMEINTGFINKVITYYGKLDSSVIKMINKSCLPKFLIAMGFLDDVYPNDCNDDFIKEAKNLGCEVEFILHSKGEHGFDAFNECEETCRVIEETIKFIEK
ncbi:hypothetical protein [Clostridium sp.]|jgi:hypothetical protein|uniref:hypothetical protein n=1 Tax=Clostridium sp. TaxID=1506 RepID=UPI00258F1611|nr:hypothetical protein [Clostridium sp.]MDF2505090.1 hypothetical protein [Clostridium sp.]